MFGRVIRNALLCSVVGVFAVPGIALAATRHDSTKSPTVMFVLRGTLTGYTAATGSVNGSVTIVLPKGRSAANRDRSLLEGATLTFPVTASTRVVLPKGSFTANDRGIVKIRASKGSLSSLSDLTTFQTNDASQVVDQGPGHSNHGHGHGH